MSARPRRLHVGDGLAPERDPLGRREHVELRFLLVGQTHELHGVLLGRGLYRARGVLATRTRPADGEARRPEVAARYLQGSAVLAESSAGPAEGVATRRKGTQVTHDGALQITPWRTRVGWLLLGALLPAMSAGAHPGQTPEQRCAIAKNKAAAKKISAKLKCQQKALEVGAVEPTCLTAAEAKFNDAIAKAEAAGGCAVMGDGPTIESAVDACVSAIVTLTSSGASTTSTTTPVVPTTTSTTLPSNPVCCATPPTLN